MTMPRSVLLRTAAWCLGVLLAGAGLLTGAVVALGTVVVADPAHSAPAITAGERFSRLVATDPQAALQRCTAARGTDFDALAGALRAGAVAGSPRFAVVEGPLRFLAAPVTGAGTDGDRAVWVWGGRGFAAVTDDARALSPDLPGPQAYGVTADAPGALRVAGCVEAAQRLAR